MPFFMMRASYLSMTSSRDPSGQSGRGSPRLKEEYQSLIKYVSNNKEADNDWFRLESNKEGTRWFGKC